MGAVRRLQDEWMDRLGCMKGGDIFRNGSLRERERQDPLYDTFAPKEKLRLKHLECVFHPIEM